MRGALKEVDYYIDFLRHVLEGYIRQVSSICVYLQSVECACITDEEFEN
jgi:hypothetical protein